MWYIQILHLIVNPLDFGLSRLCLLDYDNYFDTLEKIREHSREEDALCSPEFVSSLDG
jgi:hypothetical protein